MNVRQARFYYIFVILLVVVAGCTANTDPAELSQDRMEVIDVAFAISDELKPNTLHELAIHVTQGDENVTDATDIQFEIWQGHDREQGELIEASHVEDGIYLVEYEFPEDGIYFVQAHVTARGLHVMPTERLIVGDVSEEELESLEEDSGQSETGGGAHH